MVNPNGYTALDLIGYTDRGSYNPSANYVRNDLVHYNGNIWRVLVDDTTGITPAEGVNYTIFIESPTNATAESIAPIENAISTHAYTTGKQLYFNDKLYKVIANISVGDTLTVGTNIQLSDTITEQIADVESAIDANTTAISKGFTDVIEVTTPTFSSLPQTFTATGVTANHTLVQDGFALLSNTSAMGNDWTITTGANSVTISGTFSGSTATSVTMTLGVKNSINAT